jgi:hypothetical protein
MQRCRIAGYQPGRLRFDAARFSQKNFFRDRFLSPKHGKITPDVQVTS